VELEALSELSLQGLAGSANEPDRPFRGAGAQRDGAGAEVDVVYIQLFALG